MYDWKYYLKIIATILAIVVFPIDIVNNVIESNKPTVNINCDNCEVTISEDDISIIVNDFKKTLTYIYLNVNIYVTKLC